ncbi:HAUS augmin-like complex subunit 1 [Indicator indicator]|uniref:HAUS augmin-like complex subunit 1 n=1 Tax=Indicator indicator TaxID=1002788 RepID=UPI0023DFC701|nr:HAUS augmin-like complex subunit 1 [Indicator indicator]
MEVSVEEKFKRVTSWLKELYEDEPFPLHEINGETIDALYQLSEYNEAVEKNFALLIEDMKQSATEYEEKAKDLQSILRGRLAISLSNLSSEGLRNIDVLVNSAMTLDTKDTSLNSFFSAINDMTSELYETELKNREMELELSNMKKKLAAAVVWENQLEEDVKKSKEQMELDKLSVDRRRNNFDFLEKKTLDMNVRIMVAENKLAATGLDQSLTHEALMSLSEKVAEDQKELANLKSELEVYQDLSPSLSVAQVKVEEIKRELKALEEELTEEVNTMFLKEF